MYYYAYSLRQARFIMVNSSWTKAHVDSILQYSDDLLDALHLLPPLVLLELLARRRDDRPREARIVYPSCDTRQMAALPLAPRERVILSIAQFRPEKDHPAQLRAFHALLERYRKEIEELKKRLSEKEKENSGAPAKGRRLSAREQLDESLAMHNLNARIRQLTKLILTSQTVDENKGDESRPASPAKVDFDMSPYQVRVFFAQCGMPTHGLTDPIWIAPTRAARGAERARDTGDPNPLP